MLAAARSAPKPHFYSHYVAAAPVGAPLVAAAPVVRTYAAAPVVHHLPAAAPVVHHLPAAVSHVSQVSYTGHVLASAPVVYKPTLYHAPAVLVH